MHSTTQRQRRRGPCPRPVRYQPQLEALEDRTLPTAGLLDPTFGMGGKVTTHFDPNLRYPSSDEFADSVAVQGDGKIVVAGYSTQRNTGNDFAVARYNADGSLDGSFGMNGRVTIDVGSQFDGPGNSGPNAVSVAVQADGKIIVAGLARWSDFDSVFAVARLNGNGSLDTSFDGDGRQTIDFGFTYDIVGSVALQADGKIVVAGTCRQGGTDSYFAVARLNGNGSLDTSFDGDGRVTIDFGANDFALGVAAQADGKIVVVGSSQTNTSSDLVVARLNGDGSLDTSFDSDGKQTIDFGFSYNSARDVVLQADGKIVVAGYGGSAFAVARLNDNGTLDTSFDSDGKQIIDFGPSPNQLADVAIQADGKIVVAGYSWGSETPYASPGGTGFNFAVARLNGDGSLDTSFDADGKQTIDFGFSFDFARSVAVQTDGKIVVVGASFQGGTLVDFVVARLNGNGSLDSSFDGDGRVTTDVGYPADESTGIPDSVAVQADGKIIVAGYINTNVDLLHGIYTHDFAVARYNADGSLDQSFGTAGRTTLDLGTPDDGAYGVAVQADGKIIVAGWSYQGTGYDFAVARVNGDGSMDTSFDGDGWQTIDFGPGDAWANSVTVQANGKIVVAGQSYQDATGWDFAVARLNDDSGTLDTSFGTAGKQTIDFGSLHDLASGVAVQADGKIVVVGDSHQGITGYDFALVRLHGDNSTSLAVPGIADTYVTLQAPAGTTLVDATALPAPPPEQAPPGAEFPVGALAFTVEGVAEAGTVTVIVYVSEGIPINAYYKYNATTEMWELFEGATFEDRNGDGADDVVLELTDGGQGDADGVANGRIVDPGAPAFVQLPSRIQGLVWEDFNNNGEVDFGEKAIEGVVITLTGTDDRGNPVNRTMTTDGQGIYEFLDLRPGTYTITETQPAGFADGQESLGTVNGVLAGSATVNDQFSQVVLLPGSDGVNYNFGERPPAGGTVSCGQTATIGFWHNKHGQNLIKSLNGGVTATQLGNWLAATFVNMYGANAGVNNLTGKTNTEVAAFFMVLFKRNGHTAPAGPPKVDAQVLATALAVYVTNENLGGTTASAFGFQVTATGVGTATFNVGCNGAAFGVANNTTLSILDLLLATDALAVAGLLYDLDGSGTISAEERALREKANQVYTAINELG